MQVSSRDKSTEISQENMNKLQNLKYNIPNHINEKNVDQFKILFDKQEVKCHKTLIDKCSDECDQLLHHLNSKVSKHEKKNKKKKVEILSTESRGSLKTNNYYEYRIRELLTTCLKHTEEWLKILKKIKKELDTNESKLFSSGSSIQSENDLEKPIIMVQEIKKKLNELKQYMINENEKIKHLKTKRSEEISNHKTSNVMFSELCDTFR